jgi:hypothetical protein
MSLFLLDSQTPRTMLGVTLTRCSQRSLLVGGARFLTTPTALRNAALSRSGPDRDTEIKGSEGLHRRWSFTRSRLLVLMLLPQMTKLLSPIVGHFKSPMRSARFPKSRATGFCSIPFTQQTNSTRYRCVFKLSYSILPSPRYYRRSYTEKQKQ